VACLGAAAAAAAMHASDVGAPRTWSETAVREPTLTTMTRFYEWNQVTS